MDAARAAERKRKLWLTVGACGGLVLLLVAAIAIVAGVFSSESDKNKEPIKFKFTSYNVKGKPITLEIEAKLFYEAMEKNIDMLFSGELPADEQFEEFVYVHAPMFKTAFKHLNSGNVFDEAKKAKHNAKLLHRARQLISGSEGDVPKTLSGFSNAEAKDLVSHTKEHKANIEKALSSLFAQELANNEAIRKAENDVETKLSKVKQQASGDLKRKLQESEGKKKEAEKENKKLADELIEVDAKLVENDEKKLRIEKTIESKQKEIDAISATLLNTASEERKNEFKTLNDQLKKAKSAVAALSVRKGENHEALKKAESLYIELSERLEKEKEAVEKKDDETTRSVVDKTQKDVNSAKEDVTKAKAELDQTTKEEEEAAKKLQEAKEELDKLRNEICKTNSEDLAKWKAAEASLDEAKSHLVAAKEAHAALISRRREIPSIQEDMKNKINNERKTLETIAGQMLDAMDDDDVKRSYNDSVAELKKAHDDLKETKQNQELLEKAIDGFANIEAIAAATVEETKDEESTNGSDSTGEKGPDAESSLRGNNPDEGEEVTAEKKDKTE